MVTLCHLRPTHMLQRGVRWSTMCLDIFNAGEYESDGADGRVPGDSVADGIALHRVFIIVERKG